MKPSVPPTKHDDRRDDEHDLPTRLNPSIGL